MMEAREQAGTVATVKAMWQVTGEVLQDLRPVAVPTVILLVTAMCLLAGVSLPASLAGLTTLGPYTLLLAAAAIAVWFNRGRPFIAAVSLLLVFTAWSLTQPQAQVQSIGDPGRVAAAVFLAISLLLPLNLMLAVALPEHGVFHRQNYCWLAIAAVEILLVLMLAYAARADFSGTSWLTLLNHWLLRSPPTPVIARLMFACAFTLALMRAWPRPPATLPLPLELSMVSALIAFFFACEWAVAPGAFSAFMSATGAMLLVAVLQESHRLAFRDELTGLPGRRALEERLRRLSDAYALAVVDVDHFKQFNDTHGHDIGDQVLRLVAARLAQVEGGGTAYRYGGEEFVVLFPGRTRDEVRPHLEAIRKVIEHYRMAVRAPDRPRDRREGTALRRTREPEKVLSVTVSMGLAECDRSNRTAAQVMKAADEALYRAKGSGRNRVNG